MGKKSSKKMPEPTSSAFLDGYLEAILFTGTDESNEAGGDPLDENYTVKDFTDEALARAVKDCNAFIKKAEKKMNAASGNDEQHGHDFWLTRNGHGAGFWDRGYGEVGEELSEIARSFRECWVMVGDDGKLHLN